LKLWYTHSNVPSEGLKTENRTSFSKGKMGQMRHEKRRHSQVRFSLRSENLCRKVQHDYSTKTLEGCSDINIIGPQREGGEGSVRRGKGKLR